VDTDTVLSTMGAGTFPFPLSADAAIAALACVTGIAAIDPNKDVVPISSAAVAKETIRWQLDGQIFKWRRTEDS